MTDVTIENFEQVYPIFEKCVKEATFIALDNEMSGLNSEKWSTASLFDTNADRYIQLKENTTSFIIMQTGITTFRHVRDENRFVADSFNFYVMPRSIPIYNRQLLWQSSSIEFLTQHGFDFNKFAYRSLSYLNEDEEKELREEVYNGTFLRLTTDYIPFEISGDVETKVNEVNQWLTLSETYDVLYVDASTPLIEYLLHKEIRNRFNNVWTNPAVKKVAITKLTPEDRKIMDEDESTSIDDRLMDYYVGFTKIFRLLVSAKKPIVGHNIFLDLIFMYKQFHKTLPSRYIKFKEEIHRIFPVIYDTKHLSFNLGNIIKKEDRWKNNGLGDMYTYFREGRGVQLALYTPKIDRNNPMQFLDSGLKVHDAAWDSYYAGYIFIKMGHVFAIYKYGSGADLKPLTCKEILHAVKPYENNVNIIRAISSHVNFAGPDPESKRPQWLYAQILSPEIKDASQLAEMLSSFGNVDVKPIASRSALIAVGNYTSARDILKHFKTHKQIRIVTYNPIFHSKGLWYLLCSGMFLTGGFLVWTLFENATKVLTK